ncbi:unnamed protein product [Fusarium venenatum]|uniref:Uncharacterized protein n=1 Tax=Fusarium venenatum TaxID=56646 RepID=A0A2L2T2I0_9HYPO|nr:uncharacterized protein FVRRES_13014 [Fusarium venenatum]CEI40323.1 unnamed protein product [Fusarium venenatum]
MSSIQDRGGKTMGPVDNPTGSAGIIQPTMSVPDEMPVTRSEVGLMPSGPVQKYFATKHYEGLSTHGSYVAGRTEGAKWSVYCIAAWVGWMRILSKYPIVKELIC